MMTSIVLGGFAFLTLCLITFVICNKWNAFKNLRPGDTCGRLVECDLTCKIVTEDIDKVDVDELGYTSKIYTKSGTYTFLDFMRDNIIIIYD